MNRRNVLEVLKWASPKDVLHNASLVCHEWTRISEASELWYEFLELEGLPPHSDPKKHYRQHAFSKLAILDENTVTLIDCVQDRVEKVKLRAKVKISWNSAHVFLSKTHLLTCGYLIGKISSEAFLINLLTGEAQQIESMKTPRVGHGLIVVRSAIYALGGFQERSSEKRLVRGGRWRKLADMHSVRTWFNPCEVSGIIFVCGGSAATCEKFDPTTELFTELKVILPEAGSACSVARNGCVIVVQAHYVTAIRTDTEESTQNSLTTEKDTWSNSLPVLVGSRIFAERDETHSILIYDLSTVDSPIVRTALA